MKAKLISVERAAEALEIPLDQLPVLIGRGPEAHVRVRDPWVSRAQCRIEATGDSLVLRDLGSKHGTYVNGAAVTETTLQPQDVISVGMTRFRIQYEISTPAAALP